MMDLDLFEGLPVSRETNDMLRDFSENLFKWTKRINLIAPSTRDDIWERHILDSAQLWPMREESTKSWCDIGAGGGLPGLVLAILAKGEGDDIRFTFIESDLRKCAFLTTMVSTYALKVDVLGKRIEAVPPIGSDIVSARALAPLPKLLELATRHSNAHSTLLLQKGAQYQNEIDAARKSWHFKYEGIPSRTHPDAIILKIKEVSRA